MRIAFVGKGGSGKTTLTASFVSFLEKKSHLPVMIFDADINMNLSSILGFEKINFDKHLSNPHNSNVIKKWFVGKRIMNDLGAFRKTTPPSKESNILKIENIENTPLINFSLKRNNLYFFIVGAYQDYEIGASCYHNNLSILEIILNHTNDKNGIIVSDMVAGIDAFASTLYVQFDMLCFIVEPSKKSLEVLDYYYSLIKSAKEEKNFFVIGNKVTNLEDKIYLEKNLEKILEKDKILGFFEYDPYIHKIEREGETLDFYKLKKENQILIKKIFEDLHKLPDKRNERLKKIWNLHKKYTSQESIKIRYGDLTYQIDTEFFFE